MSKASVLPLPRAITSRIDPNPPTSEAVVTAMRGRPWRGSSYFPVARKLITFAHVNGEGKGGGEGVGGDRLRVIALGGARHCPWLHAPEDLEREARVKKTGKQTPVERRVHVPHLEKGFIGSGILVYLSQGPWDSCGGEEHVQKLEKGYEKRGAS